MSFSTAVLTDRTGVLGATAGGLSGLPPTIVALYVMLRLLIPAGLIVFATCGATPAQRINLVGDYLVGRSPHRTAHK